MSTKVIITALVLVVVIIGIWLYGGGSRVEAPSPTTTPPTSTEVTPPETPPEQTPPQTPPPETSVKTKTIEMTANGFAPSSLTIDAGTRVVFKNTDTVPHWPASGVHPTHQICPGFDALSGVSPGETYEYTFTVAKTCPFHDHLNSASYSKGTITVR